MPEGTEDDIFLIILRAHLHGIRENEAGTILPTSAVHC